LRIQKWNIPLNEFFQNIEIENFYTIILKSAAGRSLPITVLVDARANIKQQTWTVGSFHFKNILEKKRSSINFGQIFDFSFSKETEASYWRRGDLLWINFENLEEE